MCQEFKALKMNKTQSSPPKSQMLLGNHPEVIYKSGIVLLECSLGDDLEFKKHLSDIAHFLLYYLS